MEQSEGTHLGMRIIMLVIPALLMLLCLYIYFKGYRLQDKFYREVLTELETRHALEAGGATGTAECTDACGAAAPVETVQKAEKEEFTDKNTGER